MIFRQNRKWLAPCLLGLGVATWTIVVVPQTTLALCAAPENSALLGTWENGTPQTQEIKEVQIEYLCEDALSCDQTGCIPLKVGYFINIRQDAEPQDDEWGQTKAQYSSDKNLLETRYEKRSPQTFIQASVLKGGKQDGQLFLYWHQVAAKTHLASQRSGVAILTKKH